MRGESMKGKSKKSTYSTTFGIDPSKKSTYSTTFGVDPTNAERGGFEPLRHSFIYAVFRGFILKSEDFLRIFSLLISNSPTLK